MKKQEFFYEKAREISRELVKIDVIKKAKDTTIIICKGGFMAVALKSEINPADMTDKQKEDLETLAKSITPILEAKMQPFSKLYNELYEQGDEVILINIGEYAEELVSKEQVSVALKNENLEFLIERLEDKEFCMEILSAKYEEMDEVNDDVKLIYKFFNP